MNSQASLQACMDKCASDWACKSFSGQWGSWCIGCAESELVTYAAGAIAYKKQTTQSQTMTPDPGRNNYKCGGEGDPSRTYKLMWGEASEYACKSRCEQDSRCISFSGQWNQWCIGCSTQMYTYAVGAIAYRKR